MATTRRIGDICEILNGFAFKSEEYVSSGIRVMRITNVQKGKVVDDDPKFFPCERENEVSKYILRNNDLLLSLTGNVGRVGILTDEFLPAALNQRVACLRIKVPCVSLRYLYHFLNNDSFEKECIFNASGIAQKNMSTRWLEQYPIPVPPLPEQEHIVAELDLLSGIIDKYKQQLKELDTLAQSVFYDMFGDPIVNEKGWEMCLFKEGVNEMFLGPFGSSLKTDCYVDKEHSFCMVYEQKHAIKKSLEQDNHFIDEDKYNSLKRFEVHPGDLIMSCRGTIGEVYELPVNAPLGIIHPSLMKIRLREGVFNRTFFKVVLDKIIKGEDTNGGCVQMAITAKALGNKKVIYPPLDLQNEFAHRIEAVEKQKGLIKQSIAETETLFNSRMDYWFN